MDINPTKPAHNAKYTTELRKRYSEEFVVKAQRSHGERYDYSKVVYMRSTDKVIITCKAHGDFLQTPKQHIKGHGCSKCGGREIDPDAFVPRARAVHGDRYDYHESVYRGAFVPLTICCKEHGLFDQTPEHHLRGSGCPPCGLEKMKATKTLSADYYIERSKETHGDRYDYSQVELVDAKSIVTILCRDHGPFRQRMYSHIEGYGCKYCAGVIGTTERFVEKAITRHGNIYNYDKAVYINSRTRITVTCPTHGDFSINSSDFLRGSGCSGCNTSHPERQWLTEMGITVTQKKIPIPNHVKSKKTYFKADGYDPETNTVYEFYGDFWHGNPALYDLTKIHPVRKITFQEVYNETLARERIIKDQGYNMVTIWENDWKKINGR